MTGAAGFIGQSLSKYLLSQGHTVLAIDSMNENYSLELKKLRIKELEDLNEVERFWFAKMNICDESISSLIKKFAPETVVHLAAQPGVRLGLSGATQYSRDNIESFLRILQATIESGSKNFLYASSSSVYGAASSIPFTETENSLRPTSIYGVTKLANELFASTVIDSDVKCRGLRFFSVFGPKGRPDMAYFRAIASSILKTQFYMNGTGEVARDFTFIDDVCESIMLLAEELSRRPPGFKDVVNIGGGAPVTINQLVEVITKKMGEPISVLKLDAVKEDLLLTQANYEYLRAITHKTDFVVFEKGIENTINWFLKYPSSTIRKWLE